MALVSALYRQAQTDPGYLAPTERRRRLQAQLRLLMGRHGPALVHGRLGAWTPRDSLEAARLTEIQGLAVAIEGGRQGTL